MILMYRFRNWVPSKYTYLIPAGVSSPVKGYEFSPFIIPSLSGTGVLAPCLWYKIRPINSDEQLYPKRRAKIMKILILILNSFKFWTLTKEFKRIYKINLKRFTIYFWSSEMEIEVNPKGTKKLQIL